MLKHFTLYTFLSVLFLLPTFVLTSSHEETFSIPAGTTRTVPFHLSWGDTVKGMISVSGGLLHQGVDVTVTDPSDNTILNLGTVTGYTSIDFSGGFIRGTYNLHLTNPSWLSKKTVLLAYDIETNPLMHYNYEIIGIVSVVAAVIISVLLYKRHKKQ